MKSLLSFFINSWVRTTGRKATIADMPWLFGPMGTEETIGTAFYGAYANKHGLKLVSREHNGLVKDFKQVIDNPELEIAPAIVDFYEHTAAHKLEVWSQWYRPVKFFAHTLIKLISPKMEQFNIPLDPLETSRGMSNEVISLQENEQQVLACWLRKSILTNRVVYSGFYAAIEIEGNPFVRVVFPLPKGNVTVVLRVVALADGSVELLSDGKKPGSAGYYRVKSIGPDKVRYKFIPLKERIHVFEDEYGVLRTDHIFWFLGMKFLHLHYKITKAHTG